MSRAFVKDDAAESPPLVPPRPPLPRGVKNYVTPRGLALLRAERVTLDAERARLAAAGADGDRTRDLAIVARRLADLDARIASAVVVHPGEETPDAVRFGTTVTLRGEGSERRFQIVGVDEVDAATGRVAFVAPVARAAIGKRVGEAAVLKTPRGEEHLTVVAIDYDPA